VKKIKKRSFCGISSALDILGDRWSLLIIRDIIFDKKNTYGDFLNSDEKIATNILADRLIMLESAGILVKKEHPESKAKYFYKLTPKGIDLLPVLMEIVVWSDKYLEISERGKSLTKHIKNDRAGLIKKITFDSK
jgi:DNA-binding HxlR family transcriptional regulator